MDAVSDALKAAGLDPGYIEVITGVGALGGQKGKRLDPIPNIRFNQILENNIDHAVSGQDDTNKNNSKPEDYDKWGPVRRDFYDKYGF